MAIQMIFCVETNKKADTDSIYLMDAIRHLYTINNQVKISKVYMGSKSKYKSQSVLKEISEKTKAFTIGETKVIYCIDTDEFEKKRNMRRNWTTLDNFVKSTVMSCFGFVMMWKRYF